MRPVYEVLMESLSQLDLKQLAQDPEFRNLTLEGAIRLLGEKEKTRIDQEKDRVVSEVKARLEEKASAMKGR